MDINVSCVFSDFQKLQNNGEGSKSKPNVIMQGHSPSEYVLNAVSSVRPNDLEQALLVRFLLFCHGVPFLKFILPKFMMGYSLLSPHHLFIVK